MDEPSPAEQPADQMSASREGQEPESSGEPTQPQEGEQGRQYSESYVKQLRREAASSRTRLSELEERLQEYEDRDKTEQQRLTDTLTAAERKAAVAEERLLRYEVAAERGLGMAAAAFLAGTTREEIELRAEELERLLAEQGRPPAAGFDGGARPTVPEQRSPEEAHNDLLLRSLGRRAS
jgi:hypothetical protein